MDSANQNHFTCGANSNNLIDSMSVAIEKYNQFSSALSKNLFFEGSKFTFNEFEILLDHQANNTNTIFRKREDKINGYISLRCYFYKSNKNNNDLYNGPCQFEIKYQRKGDIFTIIKVYHQHNHAIMSSQIFKMLQSRAKMQFFEDDLKDWMKNHQNKKKGYQAYKMTPKSIIKALKDDGILKDSLVELIEADRFLKKKFANMVIKIKKHMKKAKRSSTTQFEMPLAKKPPEHFLDLKSNENIGE